MGEKLYGNGNQLKNKNFFSVKFEIKFGLKWIDLNLVVIILIVEKM